LKITDVRHLTLTGPRVHSVGGSAGTISKVIVRIDTDAGIYGLGEAENFMGVREALQLLRNCLIGRSPLTVRPFFSEMIYGTLPPYPAGGAAPGHPGYCSPTATTSGPIIWGLSGVEMALCDLAGKILRTPTYNLFGGTYREKVRIYLDRSAPEDVTNLDAWRDMAIKTVEAGFTQLKFDIDFAAPDAVEDPWSRRLVRPHLNRVIERITAVRECLGWDVELAADCHMHFNVSDAIQLVQELAPLKLMWIEDPVPITNPDACREVREKSTIPICVGEMFTAEIARIFIDQKACDIIHPDVLFTGGLHETRRIADYAELHYMPLALHNNGGCLATIAAGHVAAATRNFTGMEYHFIETDWIGSYVRREGLPFLKDGHLPLSDAPGLGVELNEEVCRKNLAPGEKLF